ncbi:MAG: hypothetical protein AABX74_01005 [Nanoarchaeota archaeon]
MEIKKFIKEALIGDLWKNQDKIETQKDNNKRLESQKNINDFLNKTKKVLN